MCEFEAAFRQTELGILKIKTSRATASEGICNAPNLLCSRTATLNMQPVSLRAIFSVKKKKEPGNYGMAIISNPDLNIIKLVWAKMK